MHMPPPQALTTNHKTEGRYEGDAVKWLVPMEGDPPAT